MWCLKVEDTAQLKEANAAAAVRGASKVTPLAGHICEADTTGIVPGTTGKDGAAAEPLTGIVRRRARFKVDGDGDDSTADAERLRPAWARVGEGRRRLTTGGNVGR